MEKNKNCENTKIEILEYEKKISDVQDPENHNDTTKNINVKNVEGSSSTSETSEDSETQIFEFLNQTKPLFKI